MTKLKIATELSFPIDVVTQTLAAIARKGAGKTYAATKLAELMLDAGAQVVAIDPVGNWYGLRIGSDRRSPSKKTCSAVSMAISPTPGSGRRIARLLVEKPTKASLTN